MGPWHTQKWHTDVATHTRFNSDMVVDSFLERWNMYLVFVASMLCVRRAGAGTTFNACMSCWRVVGFMVRACCDQMTGVRLMH